MTKKIFIGFLGVILIIVGSLIVFVDSSYGSINENLFGSQKIKYDVTATVKIPNIGFYPPKAELTNIDVTTVKCNFLNSWAVQSGRRLIESWSGQGLGFIDFITGKTEGFVQLRDNNNNVLRSASWSSTYLKDVPVRLSSGCYEQGEIPEISLCLLQDNKLVECKEVN
jgi:hypothetical protein